MNGHAITQGRAKDDIDRPCSLYMRQWHFGILQIVSILVVVMPRIEVMVRYPLGILDRLAGEVMTSVD